jgi:hypothetical protein
MIKIWISLSKNIYNQDEIGQQITDLQARTTNQRVKTWLKSNLRKYLLNEYEHTKPVRRGKANDPEWVNSAIQKKDLFKIDFKSRQWSAFRMDLEHAISYLETVRDPSRVSVPLAIKGGVDLLEQENKKASSDEDLEGIEVLHKFPDGYTFVNVVSKQALQREGKLMQHCVGQEQQAYIRNVAKGTLQIWSLRDKSNNPHCTIEYIPKTKKINQIKGKQNNGVVSKYVPYVKKVLEIAKKKKMVTEIEDLINIGMVEVEGNWYDIHNLPPGLKVEGDLDLEDLQIKVLPEDLEVGGSLNLAGTQITSLPEDLKVEGDLDLSDSKITVLPEDLEVGGSLVLRNTQITSLPKGLKVGGNLVLRNTQITSLPEGLNVGGNLDLSDSKITVLPKGLNVGGNLDLSDSSITSLSEGLKVGGTLDLIGTKITSLPEDLNVGGSLVLSDTKITVLPKGLNVGGNLWLRNTQITSLPEDLKVGSSLSLEDTDITVLPKGLKVGGNLVLRNTQITSLPEDLKVDGRIIS